MKLEIESSYLPYESFIRQLPETFARTGRVLYTGRNTVKCFEVDGQALVVKRYKRPNLVQRVAYTFFKQSKAERAYLYAGMFRALGIDTPHEVAYIELKQGGLLQDTYFVSAECCDPAICHTLNSADCPEALIEALSKFLVELHSRGVMHGDLNLTNILFRPIDGGNYHFTLIDTNRTKFLTSPTQQDCIRNLRTLTHNRGLYHRILTSYFRLRGWDVAACTTRAMNNLKHMEQRKQRKYRLLRLLGLKKKK